VLLTVNIVSINKTCLSIEFEGRPPANSYTDTLFCSCDLDLDPMTLDLDIPKMQRRIKGKSKGIPPDGNSLIEK